MAYSGYLSNNAAASSVDLVITSSAPRIGSFSLQGTNLVLLATNGMPGQGCYVLMATNIVLPLTNWTRVASNQFDGLGSFAFTNQVNPALLQRSYRLQLP